MYIQEAGSKNEMIYKIPKPAAVIRNEGTVYKLADEICTILRSKGLSYEKANEALYLADRMLRKDAITQELKVRD